MSTTVAILLFCGGLLLCLMSSVVLSERLDQVGHRFRLPPGLIGLVTALGADSPEISSAAAAIIGGQHDLGRGVIFGSNIFNVAMLLGLSAVVAGRVAMSRANLGFNAGVAFCLTLAVGAQTLGWIGRTVTGLLLLAVAVPYGVLSSLRRDTVRSLRLPQGARSWIERLVLTEVRKSEDDATKLDRLTPADGLSIVPLLTMIIIASVAMVRAAELLGQRWGVSQLVIGTFVVAFLTGLPNLVASVRLARQGRGTALSSEAFNSNSLNLLAGAYLPTLFVSLPGPSREAVLALGTLLALTAGAAGIGIAGRGFGRGTGVLLVAAYAAYAAVALWLAG